MPGDSRTRWFTHDTARHVEREQDRDFFFGWVGGFLTRKVAKFASLLPAGGVAFCSQPQIFFFHKSPNYFQPNSPAPMLCYGTRTTAATHQLIRDNLHETPNRARQMAVFWGTEVYSELCLAKCLPAIHPGQMWYNYTLNCFDEGFHIRTSSIH